MSLVDRDALARCCALLGSLSWLLAILSIAAAALVLGEVATIPGVSSDTVAAADQAAARETQVTAGHFILLSHKHLANVEFCKSLCHNEIK